MLSPKTQTNLANAKVYFEEHLCAGDYYAENGRVQGVWIGAGAALLGLDGTVTSDAFLALCDNRHPNSGERLTQRQKTTRTDKDNDGETANRRVFFDFTISPPKLLSSQREKARNNRLMSACETPFTRKTSLKTCNFDSFDSVHIACRPDIPSR